MAFLDFDTTHKYSIAMLVIAIEFSLIALIILITIGLKFFYLSRDKSKIIISRVIEYMLLKLTYKNEVFYKLMYPVVWKRLDILVPLICKIDKENNNEFWIKIRTKLVNEIVLPNARVATSSVNVRKRVLAAEAFLLTSDSNAIDEVHILSLVNSKIPFVSLKGIYAALKHGSEKMIDAIIVRFSEQSWLFESSNLSIFQDYLESKSNFVIKKLFSSSNSAIRAVCYNILRKCKPIDITWDIKKDIFSENIDLKISVIKFVSYCDRMKAIPFLIDSLDDKNFEVKLVSIHQLMLLKATRSMPSLERKLNDKEWWVRISAAKALLDLGFDKNKLDNILNLDPDQIFIKIPHTENMWW